MIRFPPRRILVPADLSKPSLAALRAACGLARRFGGTVSAVYAESLPPSLLGFDAGDWPDAPQELARQMQEFRQWREARLRREGVDLPPARLHVRTLRGDPRRVTALLGAARACDLIVMGTHGRRGFDRFVGGSIAEAVVAGARVPVLVLRPLEGPFRPKSVLCPVNLTPHSDDALRAARLAARRLGARLTALYVCGEGEDPRRARARLDARLDAVLGRSWPKSADARVRRGDPRSGILAEASGHDLVVLSAHRKPVFGERVLGSTAERVLRSSPVAVLTIPAAPGAARRGVRLF
ncbi:MAG: universal stress protein [Elusimicrobia bacterium]|nr:universal stress protein [Elusimicrobiota bacterium]